MDSKISALAFKELLRSAAQEWCSPCPLRFVVCGWAWNDVTLVEEAALQIANHDSVAVQLFMDFQAAFSIRRPPIDPHSL
jgi:hypothetical protein